MSLSGYIEQNSHIDCPNCEEPIFATDVIDEVDYFHKPSEIKCPWCGEKIKIKMTVEITTYMSLVNEGEGNV